jgi:phage-related protein
MTVMSRMSAPRKSISIGAMIDKARLDSDDPLLLLCQIRVVNRFSNQVDQIISIVNVGQRPEGPTNIDLDKPTAGGVTFRNVYYQPASFDVDIKESAGEVPDIRLSMQDLTGVVRSYMDRYQGGVGFQVRVMLVFDSILQRPPSEQIADYQEDFTVTGASVDDYSATLALGAQDLLATSFPRRLQISQYCQWSYKSANCGYTGSLPNCDRTLQGPNGCAAHGNALRFGGFPGIVPRSSAR